MIVMIMKSDKGTGVKRGEVYQASRAGYDSDKVILESREPDGRDPGCAEYVYNVKILAE